MPGTKGKHINAQTKVVDGQLSMLVAKSGSRAIKTELFWDIRGTGEEPFILVMTFPPGPDGQPKESNVSMPLDAAGAQAAYANHPRKVHPNNIPDDCPIHDILDALDEAGNITKPEKPPPAPPADPPAAKE